MHFAFMLHFIMSCISPYYTMLVIFPYFHSFYDLNVYLACNIFYLLCHIVSPIGGIHVDYYCLSCYELTLCLTGVTLLDSQLMCSSLYILLQYVDGDMTIH